MTVPDAYEINWLSGARRSIGRIPEKVATAVLEFVHTAVADNPQRVGKPLTLTMVGYHAARRGDYRVVYRISEERRRVDIVAVEHRSDAYRPR